MKAGDIAKVLAQGIFNFRRYICVENVSWGMLPWEADMLVCSQSGYLYEIEIKVSIADLKRDPLKSKWRMSGRFRNPLKGMWYAMPAEVWAHPSAAGCIPDFAGVIVIHPAATHRWNRAQVVKQCKPHPNAPQATPAEQMQLARLGVMRYWTRKEAA